MDPGLITVTPLLGNDLFFYSMSGDEEMNRPFEYVVDVLTKKSDIKLDDALGETMTVTVEQTTLPGFRYFNGYITRFSQLGMHGNYYVYRAVLHPWLWFLGQTSDCRIFQNHSAVDVVEKIFKKYPANLFDPASLKDRSSDYPLRDYVVQYRETDLNFISRLLEEVGISYHFVHTASDHTLVLTNDIGGRNHRPGYETVSYRPPTDTGEAEGLTSWHESHAVKTAGYVLKDFDYLKAGAPLLAPSTVGSAVAPKVTGEFYDYPGRYTDQDEGMRLVTVRKEEAQSLYGTVRAAGNVRGIGTGNIFKLVDVSWANGKTEHLVIRAHYDLRGRDPESADGGARDVFHCEVTLVDSKLHLRPPRRTPRPVVQGPQTAIVVGTKKFETDSEEIWTDDYGRVLVRFHWERKPQAQADADAEQKDNLAKPCFLRVASLWAGKNWGVQFTPRIGQEVMVEFLEGDPDRPIVTGRLYNNFNMPPYDNKKKNQSGIKTHSTIGGGPNNYNELRFDDTKGKEEVFIQAEKNKNVNVKNNRSATVGANDSVTVGGDRSVTVTGNLDVTVNGKGQSPIHSSHSVTGKYNLHASDTIEEDAPTHIKLTCGGSSILIEPNQITLMAGGKSFVVLNENIEAQSSQSSMFAMDDAVFAKSKKGGAWLLDQDAVMVSNDKSQLRLDANATLTTGSDVKVGGKHVEINGDEKVAANGGKAQVELSAAGATMSGSKVGVSGQSMTEITGAVVKIN